MDIYPTIDTVPETREIEYLVAKHFANIRYGNKSSVKLGNDEEGIPDAFIFSGNKLLAAVELSGYILAQIEDIRSHTLKDGVLHIDIGKCTEIHSKQPHPYTIIEKKIRGKRKYKKFDDADLVLLIYSDVRCRNNELVFPSIGRLQISPSCNYFAHNRLKIIEKLKKICSEQINSQWSETWLIDYGEFISSLDNKPQRLDK